MASFCPEKQACPSCGSAGNCHIHAYYVRKVIDFIHGHPVTSEVTVLRLICKNCGHTHAVLPDLLIPYRSYGLFFILRVLGESFLHLSSLERLCERFHITRNQFYQWKHLWAVHKREWLGILEDSERPDISFLVELMLKPVYSSFAQAFTSKAAHSFLQSHRDPGPVTG